MPADQVIVRRSDLVKAASRAQERGDLNLATRLRSALSQEVEERRELQIVGDDLKERRVVDGEDWGDVITRARARVEELSEWFTDIRIQSRTIYTFKDGSSYTTGWSDLEESS